MDIESAFADGPFGSGVKPETKKPEPSEPTETTAEPRDAAGEAEPVVAKADSKADARDERDDSDDEGKIEGPPGSEGLQKALKSERSLRREHRKGLSEALKRSEQLEAQNRQLAAQVAAIQQQQMAAAQQQIPQKQDAEPGFFELGPEEYTRRVAEAQAKKIAEQFAPQIDRMRRQHVDQSEALYVQAKPEARATIDRFVALARADQRVMSEYQAVLAGTHPLAAQDPTYQNPVLFADAMGQSALVADEITRGGGLEGWRKAERAKWEAEAASKQVVDEPRGVPERRAPLTLAGRRGGGSSVTPAPAGGATVESQFRF